MKFTTEVTSIQDFLCFANKHVLLMTKKKFKKEQGVKTYNIVKRTVHVDTYMDENNSYSLRWFEKFVRAQEKVKMSKLP